MTSGRVPLTVINAFGATVIEPTTSTATVPPPPSATSCNEPTGTPLLLSNMSVSIVVLRPATFHPVVIVSARNMHAGTLDVTQSQLASPLSSTLASTVASGVQTKLSVSAHMFWPLQTRPAGHGLSPAAHA
jgi:hypothetical protein